MRPRRPFWVTGWIIGGLSGVLLLAAGFAGSYVCHWNPLHYSTPSYAVCDSAIGLIGIPFWAAAFAGMATAQGLTLLGLRPDLLPVVWVAAIVSVVYPASLIGAGVGAVLDGVTRRRGSAHPAMRFTFLAVTLLILAGAALSLQSFSIKAERRQAAMAEFRAGLAAVDPTLFQKPDRDYSGYDMLYYRVRRDYDAGEFPASALHADMAKRGWRLLSEQRSDQGWYRAGYRKGNFPLWVLIIIDAPSPDPQSPRGLRVILYPDHPP